MLLTTTIGNSSRTARLSNRGKIKRPRSSSLYVNQPLTKKKSGMCTCSNTLKIVARSISRTQNANT